MIRTIFFDFGNVLGFFDHGRAVAKLAKHTDMGAVELALELYGGVIADDYECGKVTTEEYAREALLNGRLKCSPAEFLDCYHDIFWPNDAVCDVVPRLKPRYRLVLASNTNEAHYQRYTRDFAGVLAHFDHLVPSHHTGARKPHEGFFTYCLRYAGAEAGECLFVDDLPVNVEAAERAGMRGLVYTPGERIEPKLAAAGVVLG